MHSEQTAFQVHVGVVFQEAVGERSPTGLLTTRTSIYIFSESSLSSRVENWRRQVIYFVEILTFLYSLFLFFYLLFSLFSILIFLCFFLYTFIYVCVCERKCSFRRCFLHVLFFCHSTTKYPWTSLWQSCSQPVPNYVQSWHKIVPIKDSFSRR